jgi:hypothetical protein
MVLRTGWHAASACLPLLLLLLLLVRRMGVWLAVVSVQVVPIMQVVVGCGMWAWQEAHGDPHSPHSSHRCLPQERPHAVAHHGGDGQQPRGYEEHWVAAGPGDHEQRH